MAGERPPPPLPLSLFFKKVQRRLHGQLPPPPPRCLKLAVSTWTHAVSTWTGSLYMDTGSLYLDYALFFGLEINPYPGTSPCKDALT